MASEARAARTARERAASAALPESGVPVSEPRVMHLVDGTSTCPSAEVVNEVIALVLVNSDGAPILTQRSRTEQVAHGKTLGHRGVVLRGFTVSHRDVVITRKAGDVILADAE